MVKKRGKGEFGPWRIKAMFKWALFFLIFVSPRDEAMGEGIGVPHRFTNGNVADARDVNANFDYLAGEIEKVLNGEGKEGFPVTQRGRCEEAGVTVAQVPEVLLDSPPLVQVWLSNSNRPAIKIQPFTLVDGVLISGPVIAKGKVIFRCVRGWFYDVVVFGAPLLEKSGGEERLEGEELLEEKRLMEGEFARISHEELTVGDPAVGSP